MSPAELVPGSSGDWLARANGDLALARVALPAGAFYEDLCYHAQQAAEKSIKAVYVARGWPFRFVHDLEVLLTELIQAGLEIGDDILASAELTTYATRARYPGIVDPVTPEEYREAVVLAERVVAWAHLQASQIPTDS